MPPEQGQEPPKKFIRTFESDMAAIQSGAVTPPPSREAIPPESTRAPQVEAPIPLVPESPKEEPMPMVQKNRPLKTYAGDFSERVAETGASAMTVLAAEQDARAGAVAAPESAPVSHRNIYLVGIGGVLFVAALIAGYFAYARYTTLSLPVPILTTPSAPFAVEDEETLVGRGPALLSAIQLSLKEPLGAGGVRLLLLSATSTTIFSELQLGVPGVVLRSIVPEKSVMGILSDSSGQSPFFILNVSSFGDSFAGMLQWEARILTDLGSIFPPHPSLATTTASTTPEAATPPRFVDRSVENHDIRALVDAEGREIIVYGYWNQRTLVIARNTGAFTELLRRIANSRSYR